MGQLVGALSHNWNIVGSIPSQGTYPGCRSDPPSRCMWPLVRVPPGGTQPVFQHWCFLHWCFSPSLPLTLKAMKKRKKKHFLRLMSRNCFSSLEWGPWVCTSRQAYEWHQCCGARDRILRTMTLENEKNSGTFLWPMKSLLFEWSLAKNESPGS